MYTLLERSDVSTSTRPKANSTKYVGDKKACILVMWLIFRVLGGQVAHFWKIWQKKSRGPFSRTPAR
jgi:hypothetical protein